MSKAATAFPLVALALASCGGPKQVEVDHAYVRLPVTPGRPAAAYFDVHGGPVDTQLISVESPEAARTQMHQSREINGLDTMLPLRQVEIPADKTVKFEPGGKHVMLFGLKPDLRTDSIVHLRFTFADGKQIDEDAKAIAATAPRTDT
ncbi:MAG: copper chaperone PCu(A)C [Sphingomonas sp.]